MISIERGQVVGVPGPLAPAGGGAACEGVRCGQAEEAGPCVEKQLGACGEKQLGARFFLPPGLLGIVGGASQNSPMFSHPTPMPASDLFFPMSLNCRKLET